MCNRHGGMTAEIATARAATTVASLATAAGIEVPAELTPRDYGRVISAYVVDYSHLFTTVKAELVRLRGESTDTAEWLRDNADLITQMNTAANNVSKMMTAAGALGVRIEEDPDDDPTVTGAAKLLAVIEDLRSSRDETMDRCESCAGQGYVPREEFGGPVVVASSSPVPTSPVPTSPAETIAGESEPAEPVPGPEIDDDGLRLEDLI